MSTIFVAYGGPGNREEVLAFAAERAAASGDDLLVYHVQETAGADAAAIRTEIHGVLEAWPDVERETVVDVRETNADETNVSGQKRLVDAVLETDRDLAYVVMGDVERGTIDSFAVPSMTAAVLETHAVPVVLVPV